MGPNLNKPRTYGVTCHQTTEFMSQDRRTTRPRMTPWDRDGTHGRPSSFDILLEWLASNGNEGYLRWISSEGKRPELCGEIIAMLYLHGIHHRTHKCIHLKMFMLINSYKDACNHLRDHGGSLSDMHPKYGTMEGLMNRICPRWSQLNEIMAPQMVHPTPQDE
ncbi:hypothetical protein MJO28_015824 [Puccinia striiformis f. sp. tritici]|uniref:Uncharacterized protein n=1 Tax=Puccinia striiformis f. sp. tritici TaxID=168172 RepID=A0ACC0DPS0_9BASI|nr:hypothetical protein MJO28_015824 [Puccinia striiformis f. sp. tritici]